MGREPISDMIHLVVISYFALHLDGTVTKDGGRAFMWSYVDVFVRIQYWYTQETPWGEKGYSVWPRVQDS